MRSRLRQALCDLDLKVHFEAPSALPTYTTCTATKAAVAANIWARSALVPRTNVAVKNKENMTITISLQFAL